MIGKAVAVWCVVASLILFFSMGIDKRRARKNKRRISEKALFTWALLGGAAGGWLGMRAFHHKTKHWYFRIGFPLLAIAEAAGLIWLSWNR